MISPPILALEDLGWSPFFEAGFEPYRNDDLVPGRLSAQHRGVSILLTEHGELRADLAGRLAHDSRPGDLPAVGDWVAARPRLTEASATIHAVLPRRTKFSRKEVWARTEEQVVAANVDTVFLVTAFGHDLNLRRLERYLATAWESGAEPVIVVAKSDLEDDVEASLATVEAIAFGVPVHAVSSVTGEGVEELARYLGRGRTVALLGSSGVGKSTLVNRLAGRELLATGEVRADGRGRHTTSHRELVSLPGGGLLLDTPGMRELQLWDAGAGVEEAFEDVSALAARCRFNDCAHEGEPGCAVAAALEDGSLAPERFESYRKLQRELQHLETRQDARLAAEQRKRWKAVSKAHRVDKY